MLFILATNKTHTLDPEACCSFSISDSVFNTFSSRVKISLHNYYLDFFLFWYMICSTQKLRLYLLLNIFVGVNFSGYANMSVCEHIQALQVVLVVKNLPANAGEARDAGLNPG